MSSSSAYVQAPVRGGNCPLFLALQSSESSFQFALLLDGQRVLELAQLLLQPPYLPPPLALLRAPPFPGGGGRGGGSGGRGGGDGGRGDGCGERGCRPTSRAFGIWAISTVPADAVVQLLVVPPVVQGAGARHSVHRHVLAVFDDRAERCPAVHS